MKKFTKICLIISLIMILVGGTICAIGAVSGGWKMVDEMGRSGRWAIMSDSMALSYNWGGLGGRITRQVLENIGTGITNEIADEITDEIRVETRGNADDISEMLDDIDDMQDDFDYSDDWEDDWEHHWEDDWEDEFDHAFAYGTSLSNGYTDTGVAADQIREMKIMVGGAAVYFKESDSDKFGIEVDGKGDYKYYSSDGVFYLEGNRRHSHLINFKNEKIYLYIPKGMEFKNVEVGIGAGVMDMGQLAADTIKLISGAGIVTASGIDCRSLELEVGAGSAELKGLNVENLDIMVGMGSAVIEGNISKKIDGECGLGVIELELAGVKEDYNYELSCSAGSIQLGNQSYSGLDKEKYIDNNAAGECDLECAMGEIIVSYTRD